MIRSISITEASHNVLNADKSRIRWTVVGVVALTLFCDYFLLTLVIPIFPELFGNDFSSFEIGILFAVKPFFQFFCNPLVGDKVDKIGPVYPLFFGTIVLAAATLAMTLGAALESTPNTAYALVIVARSIQGVSSASTMSAGMALMSTTHDESLQGTVMGIAMTGVAFGNLLGPPLGGVLGYYLNLWFPFSLVAVILLLDIVLQVIYVFLPHVRQGKKNVSESPLLTTLIPESTPTSDSKEVSSGDEVVEVSPFQTMWFLLHRTDILTVVGAAIISNSSIGVIEPLVPKWLDDEFGQNILWQGLIFGFTTLAYLMSTPLAGVLSDYVPIWSCMVFGFGCMGTGLLLFYIAGSIAFACVCLFLIGFGMGFVDIPILPLLADIVKELSPSDGTDDQVRLGDEKVIDDLAISRSMNISTSSDTGSRDGTLPYSNNDLAGHRESQHKNVDEMKELLGVTYAMNDMCFSIGFFLGPLVGTGVETAFGDGQKGFRRAMLSIGVLCFLMIPIVFVNLGFRKSNLQKRNAT